MFRAFRLPSSSAATLATSHFQRRFVGDPRGPGGGKGFKEEPPGMDKDDADQAWSKPKEDPDKKPEEYSTRYDPQEGEHDMSDGRTKVGSGQQVFKAPLQTRMFPGQEPHEIGDKSKTTEGFGQQHFGSMGARYAEAERRFGLPTNQKSEAYAKEQAEKRRVDEEKAAQEARMEGTTEEERDNYTVDPATGLLSKAKKTKGYTRSKDRFRHKTVFLDKSYSGTAESRRIKWWENIYYNYIRYWGTYEYLVGKDRYGNKFLVAWYISRSRQEMRKCFRADRNKSHQPYGCLPTDNRLWEEWMRGWRAHPPTPEEEEFYRRKKRERHGLHVLGDEEFEDTIVRTWAHSKVNAPVLQEVDDDQEFNKFMIASHQRARDSDPTKEADETWTAAFVRGDMFYNEEETEVMRSSLSSLYRDKQWQMLELKRQNRMRRQPYPVRKPNEEHMNDPTSDPKEEPFHHTWERQDNHVPFTNGVSDLTTPELERLRVECDAIEEERVALRKELGLTDTGDMRDGREPIDKGYEPYQAPPTSERWKPKCWREPWGQGGAKAW